MLGFEVGLFECAARCIAATRNRKETVDAAVRAAIRIGDESRFAHRAVALKKRRHDVRSAGDECAFELRVALRAGTANAGRRVTASAILEIEGGAESGRVRIANAAVDRVG